MYYQPLMLDYRVVCPKCGSDGCSLISLKGPLISESAPDRPQIAFSEDGENYHISLHFKAVCINPECRSVIYVQHEHTGDKSECCDECELSPVRVVQEVP